MISVINVSAAAALAVLGFVLGPLGCRLLNKIPAKWLCDYDEEPSEELLSGVRFKAKPAGIIMGAAFAVVIAVSVLTNGLSIKTPVIFALYFFLMLISASDAKYTIIPDQFTAAVLALSLVLAIVDFVTVQSFIKAWYDPLIGGACGGLILIVLDLLSTWLFKKPGFGFGDVKLLAALGVMFGWKCILILLVIASFAAVIHFLVLVFSGKAKNGIYLPMGPYLCIAAAIIIITQPYFASMYEWYVSLLTMTVLP